MEQNHPGLRAWADEISPQHLPGKSGYQSRVLAYLFPKHLHPTMEKKNAERGELWRALSKLHFLRNCHFARGVMGGGLWQGANNNVNVSAWTHLESNRHKNWSASRNSGEFFGEEAGDDRHVYETACLLLDLLKSGTGRGLLLGRLCSKIKIQTSAEGWRKHENTSSQ